jgi:hypothetical protein
LLAAVVVRQPQEPTLLAAALEVAVLPTQLTYFSTLAPTMLLLARVAAGKALAAHHQ